MLVGFPEQVFLQASAVTIQLVYCIGHTPTQRDHTRGGHCIDQPRTRPAASLGQVSRRITLVGRGLQAVGSLRCSSSVCALGHISPSAMLLISRKFLC